MALVERENIQLTNPSDRTIAERNKFAGQLDDFATFSWGNIEDMFVEFGAFIINEKKGSLKIYNGASFTNNYTKQQFQDGYTNLAGVTFNTQQISFTIGVYWFSIEDYRLLMNVLHPYEVSMLGFSFEKKYGYRCKLSNIKDSTRYVLGQEGSTYTPTSNKLKYSHLLSGDSKGYRYYTELQLTFDVIGAQCARQRTPYIINQFDTNTIQYSNIYNTTTNKWTWSACWPSDLDFPITIDCEMSAVQTAALTQPDPILAAYALIQMDNQNIVEPVKLFELNFKNLLLDTDWDDDGGTQISLTYDSEQGLIYWDLGSKKQILSLLSINQDGKRFINSIECNRFFFPGRLNYPEVDNHDYVFIIRFETANNNIHIKEASCTMSARTNII